MTRAWASFGGPKGRVRTGTPQQQRGHHPGPPGREESCSLEGGSCVDQAAREGPPSGGTRSKHPTLTFLATPCLAIAPCWEKPALGGVPVGSSPGPRMRQQGA